MLIIILLIILILLSAFFHALEVAFKGITKGKIKQLTRDKEIKKRNKDLFKIIEKKNSILDSISIWNTFITILIGTAAACYCMRHLYSSSCIPIISFSFFALIVLILARTTAQKIALKKSMSIALETFNLVKIILFLAYPLIKVFEVKKETIPVTEEEMDEEIKMVVKHGEECGFLEKEERAMIHSVIEFGETITKEVMIPRIDMKCIPVDSTIKDFLTAIIDCGFSRMPVYEKSIDNIAGIAYSKDLLKYLKDGSLEDKIGQIMRKPYFVPNSKKIDDLFKEMQKNKISLALVVDEYGGTDGLITLEDILEEIVGEITDEHDITPVSGIEKLEDGSYLINAKMIIEDVNEKLNLNIPVENFETIGGFVYGKLERIPRPGEILEMEDFSIKVEKIVSQRLLEVRLMKKHSRT